MAHPKSNLTYSEISDIVSKLEGQYRFELGALNADTIIPYKVLQGKLLGLKELMQELDDFCTTRGRKKTFEDTGDIDEID